MPEFRGRRHPEAAAKNNREDDSRSQQLPSILRHNSSTTSNKSTSFAPGTVLDGGRRHRIARIRAFVVLAVFVCMVLGSFYLSFEIVMENQSRAQFNQQPTTRGNQAPLAESQATSKESQSERESHGDAMEGKKGARNQQTINKDKCEFRTYPPNRLYGLASTSQPSFLSDATYIRGEWPIIINPASSVDSVPTKVCINTTSWENSFDQNGNERLPFTDGHNPSVISLKSNPYDTKLDHTHVRLDPKHLEPIASAFPSGSIDALFLGISIFGNGQCKFGLTPEDVTTYRFSALDEPPNGKRAIISILSPPGADKTSFQTLMQTTLLLERDAKYGSNRRAIPSQKSGSKYARMHQEFDDPRLFFYDGRIWVLYRNGPLFGYNDQIHNPIHFEEASPDEKVNGVKFVAYVKASETVRVCCGRNIALISEEVGLNSKGSSSWVENPRLKALTWVDPVTVVDVNLGDVPSKINNRRLLDESSSFTTPRSNRTHTNIDSNHRRLKGSQTPKSNIHGTNGYMVPLPSTGELLGIAHFHRPEHRQSSDYALHGHHYTHVFFTIARYGNNDAGSVDSRPFKLKRLSNEFVFQTQSMPISEVTRKYVDADVIQFASGLDLVGSDVDGTLIIAYGINDCEGAVFTMGMDKVLGLLIEVEPGQEVVDLMQTIKKK
ncbi:hypothetical protein HJC23_000263 [Cyclotella cryptica]|uniref:Uncharacterized protein n=1 Tax=Cyclotella cryptica TaxID=29204 RepID=A0ABD3QBL0_9STRA|eukprot:CCRYP_006839-RA/>CCRYP_006839-RA protein AED:0.25 eAED:0.25 QI:0/-1/0/1/-1/1/1/0/663